jgi:hypothetical protein
MFNHYDYETINDYYGILPVVPHKAVAEVSKIGNLSERGVAGAQKWQSEPTDGLKGG